VKKRPSLARGLTIHGDRQPAELRFWRIEIDRVDEELSPQGSPPEETLRSGSAERPHPGSHALWWAIKRYPSRRRPPEAFMNLSRRNLVAAGALTLGAPAVIRSADKTSRYLDAETADTCDYLIPLSAQF
jgi:hypothetical protein